MSHTRPQPQPVTVLTHPAWESWGHIPRESHQNVSYWKIVPVPQLAIWMWSLGSEVIGVREQDDWPGRPNNNSQEAQQIPDSSPWG